MDTIEAIMKRRSIRSYTREAMPEDIITTLLQAAMAAPSSENSQPWHFIVVDDRKTLNRIPLYYPYAFMTRRAPLAIIVCGDETVTPFANYWTLDCAAATENILITAVSLGLGACWCGAYLSETRQEVSFQEWLGIPRNIIQFAIIAIGYPAETRPPANRYNKDRIHTNRW